MQGEECQGGKSVTTGIQRMASQGRQEDACSHLHPLLEVGEERRAQLLDAAAGGGATAIGAFGACTRSGDGCVWTSLLASKIAPWLTGSTGGQRRGRGGAAGAAHAPRPAHVQQQCRGEGSGGRVAADACAEPRDLCSQPRYEGLRTHGKGGGVTQAGCVLGPERRARAWYSEMWYETVWTFRDAETLIFLARSQYLSVFTVSSNAPAAGEMQPIMT